jgi:hypothetical protein
VPRVTDEAAGRRGAANQHVEVRAGAVESSISTSAKRYVKRRVLVRPPNRADMRYKGKAQRKRMFAASELPSASLAIRDCLFRHPGDGRNGAECGRLRPFVRTRRGGRQVYSGRFSVSLLPLSLTQPNHAHFGTVVESTTNQRVTGMTKGWGLKEFRSGEVNRDRTVRFSVSASGRRAGMPSAGRS